MKIFTKITLLLIAALFQFTTISAYDFEVGYIRYTITSDSTVEVSQVIWDNFCNSSDYLARDFMFYELDIPSDVYYNGKSYIVNTIGEEAMSNDYQDYWSCDWEGVNTYSWYNITLPETIISMRYPNFGNWYHGNDMINLICLAKTPPFICDFDLGSSEINLYVYADAYPLYKEYNDQHHCFSSIHITDGTCAEFSISVTELDNGCAIRMNSNENTTIHYRAYICYRLANLASVDEGISNYYCYENTYPCRFRHVYFLAYAIEEGKSPSYIDYGWLGGEQGYHKPWETSFDFTTDGIAYSFIDNSLKVVEKRYYPNECSEGPPPYFLYSGKIEIPNAATYHNYEYDSDTSYPVTSIGRSAFSLNSYDEVELEFLESEYGTNNLNNITSVILPASITSVEEYAFGDCPNLSFIKCKGATPPTALDNSFDDGVYQNTTLYVPMDAVDAYRNATGWKNFANIVGHYDFDYDFEVDGVYYAIVGDNVIVTNGEKAYQGVVSIPASVTYEGTTYSVSGISSSAFADATLQSLIIPVTISTIGEGAFTGCHIGTLVITGNGAWTAGAIGCDVDGLYVMSDVTSIQGLLVNPATTVYAYATVPPACDSQSFSSYDAALHVPASALAAYFTAPYWNYFINITSDAVEPKNISLNNDSIEVLVGNQLTLTATPAPANATPGDIIWTSSDEAVATVQGGVITAVHGGECDIKAYLLDKTAVCHLTVTEIAPTEISVSPEFAKLEIGSQLTLTATVLPEEATDKVVTWTTSNSAVATVDNMGTVTAVGQGECYITATCRDNQAMCHVIVVDHFVYITLDQHEVRLMPNHMDILTPSVMPEGTPIVVTSTNPNVAAARMANGNIQIVGIQEGRTLIKVNSTDGYAEADSCLVKVYTLRGDVNCDGFVNINDVTSLINYLLSHNADGIDVINADANNDGKVNIADVTRLINHLLSGDELDPKEEPDENTLTFTVNGVTFTMVAVEGGTFTMGATPEQVDDALDWEYPTHQVTLSNYAIGQTEVTQALWEAVTGTNPSRFQGRPNNPVELVDWNDCQAFITQLNALTGKQFRLPTEAEWEFAARGGNNSQHYKYAGSNDFDEVGWHSGNSSSTQPVGSKKANELGIYDMSGNVWEWCQDYFGDYTSEAQTNPTGPETGTDRIRRGVGWNGSISSGRVSHRSSREATYKYNSQGLRLAL